MHWLAWLGDPILSKEMGPPCQQRGEKSIYHLRPLIMVRSLGHS